MTECTQIGFDFPPVKTPPDRGPNFPAGDITCDGGLLFAPAS